MSIKDQLYGKKLLLLGDSLGTKDMILYAKKHGVYVIVTDHYPPEKSGSKLLANEYWNISTADIDRLGELVKHKSIDGIFAGVSEFNLEKAMLLCHQHHLPFYALTHQWDIATNKNKFKNICQKFDIPTPKSISIDIDNYNKHKDQYQFPVVVKPIDSRAGMGVLICNNAGELIINYQKSIKFSKSEKVLIEPLITAEQINIYYAIQKGEISLVNVADRYVKNYHDGNLPLPVAFILPSKHLRHYETKYDKQVKKMINSMGIQNGVLFIQSFVDNDTFIFYEMGFRLNGSLEYKITTKLNNFNPVEMMINYALTGEMYGKPINEILNPYYSKLGCIINILVKPGIIGSITGVNEVASLLEVINVDASYSEGDIIEEKFTGTLKQVILRISVISNSQKQLFQLINNVQKMIKVYNLNGENMVLSGLDPDELLDEKAHNYRYTH